MIKRFFLLVITAAFISSFLLLAGTAILDRVNAARTSSQLEALRLAGSSASANSGADDLDTRNQDPISMATEPALENPAARTIGEVLANPQSFTSEYLTLTGTAALGENNSVMISDGTGELQVVIERSDTPLTSGEKLTVTGLIRLTDAGANLDACRVVNSLGMVIQLHGCDQSNLTSAGLQPAAAAPTSTIADLINNPASFYNQLLTLTGLITILDNDEFLLNDGTGQIIVDIDENQQFEQLPFTNGQMVTVRGYFENDGQYLDIDACEITSEDGTKALVVDCLDQNDDDDVHSDDQSGDDELGYDDDSASSGDDSPDDEDDQPASGSNENEDDNQNSGSDDQDNDDDDGDRDDNDNDDGDDDDDNDNDDNDNDDDNDDDDDDDDD
jgi:uncharacterized protein YdeI (BOF family)